jgi:hypothetical protein
MGIHTQGKPCCDIGRVRLLSMTLVRGVLVSCFEIAINVGLCSGYLVGRCRLTQ